MKIFDAHVHLFPDQIFRAIWKWFDDNAWKIQYQVSADDVVRILKEHGIERFLVLNYAHKAGIAKSLNEWTYNFCSKYPEAIPLGTVHPDDEDIDKILDKCFVDYKFAGLKLHCHVTSIRPDDERMSPIYEKLIEHDKIFVLHAGVGPSLRGYKEHTKEISGVRFVKPVLKRYPELKLTIPHLGTDEADEFFELMTDYPNLRMDTTMVLGGFFPVEIPWDKIETFSDRILFGSDFPNIPYDLMTEINAILNSPLSPEAQERVLCSNACRLLDVTE
jgi:predicted TIM-barrel fold metal-dependent hydrolase